MPVRSLYSIGWSLRMTARNGRAPRTDFAALVQPRQVTPPTSIDVQRRSFAFGNCAIENPRVTRELVDREDKRLKARTVR
jgi:hypothetical protein